MEKQSLFDQLVNGVAHAVSDVREKLVNEAWFGKSSAPIAGQSDAPSNFANTQIGAPPAQSGDALSEEELAQMQEFTRAVLDAYLEPVTLWDPEEDGKYLGMGEDIDPETGMDR